MSLKLLNNSAPESHESLQDFEQLYEKHHRMVRAVVFNISGQNDVDDLVQETFVRIWKAREQFRGEAATKTWIYRIAVNAAVDHYRSRARWKFTLLSPALEDEKSGERKGIAKDLVAKGLASLTEEQRVVLVLQSMEGLSHREIAEVLEIPEGTVRSRLHYAKESFLEFLEKEKVEL